jgi:hypothetical protein
MPKRRKQAKNLSDVRHMLACLLTDARVDETFEGDKYEWPEGPWTSRGPWDARYVDHVLAEVDRFINSGIDAVDACELRWQRSLKYWMMGRFDEAAQDAAVAVEFEPQRNRAASILAGMKRTLAAMQEGKSFVDIMDEP